MARELTNEAEALNEVIEKINEASGEGKRWMVAVWTVTENEKGEPDQVEPLSRVTWKFPTPDFDKAVGQLALSLASEVGTEKPPVPGPLKRADFKVFDEDGEEEPSEPSSREAGVKIGKQSGEPLPKAMSIGEFMKGREGEDKQ